MRAYKDLKKVEQVGKQIINRLDGYKAEIAKSSCDKHDIGFNKDSRFSSATVEISIDAYTGYYGNSGCCCIPLVRDRDIFNKFFIQTLNNRFEELMRETAENIIEHASTMKEKAIKEMEEAISKLKND
jgi:hypothetical protein